MAEEATPAPAAPAQTRSERISEAIKEAVAQTTPNEKAPAAPEKAEAPKEAAPEVKPKAEDRSFEKLLKEKAAMRPFMEAAKGLHVDEVRALARAKAAKDPMAALKALGYTYEDVATRVAGLPPADKKDAAPAENPDLAAVRAEVQSLKAERSQENAAKLRTEALTKAKDVVKGKFKHIEALEAEEKVLAYIETYWRQAGELPGESFEDSIELAAAHVEKELSKEAERWKKVLTPATDVPTVPAEGARNASAGQGTTGKTLTNSSATAPARGVPQPTNREELFKQLLADPNAPWAQTE